MMNAMETIGKISCVIEIPS